MDSIVIASFRLNVSNSKTLSPKACLLQARAESQNFYAMPYAFNRPYSFSKRQEKRSEGWTPTRLSSSSFCPSSASPEAFAYG
jgi:hypothetical protein